MSVYTERELQELGFAWLGENVRVSRKASFYGIGRISIGSHSRIDDFCVLSAGVGGISIGHHCHIAIMCSLIGRGRIEIGDLSTLSGRVSVYSSSDDYSGAAMTNPTVPEELTNVDHRPVSIGRHVVVGAGSVVLPGAVIQDGAAVGALSLVKGRLETCGFYAGVPARFVGPREREFLRLEFSLPANGRAEEQGSPPGGGEVFLDQGVVLFPEELADVRRLFIFGAGGFGREVAWLADQIYRKRVEIEFLLDTESSETHVNGIPIRRLDDVEPAPEDAFVVAVGDPIARERLVQKCRRRGLRETSLVHPGVEASRFVTFGSGSIVCAGAIATVNIAIGAHVHVNLDCTIGHDVHIGDYATLSPGVHVSGNVIIGSRVFVGTGATIINGKPGHPLTIGDDAVIAAGTCVTASVEEKALVAGVPAVRKR